MVNKKAYKEQLEDKTKHQGYIHFYTAVLLENDHRVNYHWHIEDSERQNIISQLLQGAGSLGSFV